MVFDLQVWASKWNDRAWLSRRARGVPDSALFMAALIQQVSFDVCVFSDKCARPLICMRAVAGAATVLLRGSEVDFCNCRAPASAPADGPSRICSCGARCRSAVWDKGHSRRGAASAGARQSTVHRHYFCRLQVVPAEYAFVVHTADPLSGAKGTAVGELVVGMGEALVGNMPGRALSFSAATGNGAGGELFVHEMSLYPGQTWGC